MPGERFLQRCEAFAALRQLSFAPFHCFSLVGFALQQFLDRLLLVLQELVLFIEEDASLFSDRHWRIAGYREYVRWDALSLNRMKLIGVAARCYHFPNGDITGPRNRPDS